MKRTTVTEQFKSLQSFLSTMDQRPTNYAFKHSILSSTSTDRPAWRGTKTYDTAIEVIRTGYREPLDRMKKAIIQIGKKENYKRPRLKNSVAGFLPNVPAHLMGLPEAMFYREPRKQQAKTIHLVYSFCASANVDPENLVQAGINFISLVNSLEKQDYRVKIDVLFSTVTEKTAASFSVTVKDYGQPLNLLKLAFPLIHPSMLRRIAFKWLETTPDLSDRLFTGGYGVPLTVKLKDLKKEHTFLLENRIIKKEAFYCNVYQAFEANNIKELATAIGIEQQN